MGRNGGRSGPVPDRWMNCPRKATHLIYDKFMAFKTPLGSHFDDKVPPENRFHPKMIFDMCSRRKIHFGLWIDLTNTTRFYDKEEVQQEGCKYLKLPCRGHGETPDQEQTQAFINIVHKYIASHPLKAIAIHCTHGFNRTGFLIVSYLIEKLDFGIEVALEMFAEARPPGIYKADYIQELYRRFDDINDAPPPPELPSWCFETEPIPQEIDNSEASSSSYESEPPVKKSKRSKGNPTFMPGVPGVFLFTEQPKVSSLQKLVQNMCGWKSSGFPGCQPVSMSMQNLVFLHQKPYRVSWKADGTRYMMLIDGPDEIYFFDRNHNVFKVKGLRFPHRKDLKLHLNKTLLDGEMVIDKFEGRDIPRYLAYDVIKFDGKDVGKMPFYPTRLQCLDNEIVQPRYKAMQRGIINKDLEPFSVRKKEFWHITQTASLLGENFAKNLCHEPDGLIFQPAKEPYVAGSCEEVLKWKPLELNSVDFRLNIAKEEGDGIVSRKVCYLYVGQLDRPFAMMKYKKSLKDLHNKIVECKLEDNQWKFMRERTDKSFPNSFKTAKAVLETIKTPVTKEELLSYIEKYRFYDDSELMPPPDNVR